MSQEEVDQMKAEWRAHLDGEFESGDAFKPNKADWLDGKWAGMKRADNEDDPRRGETGLPLDELKDIGRKLTHVPRWLQYPPHYCAFHEPA